MQAVRLAPILLLGTTALAQVTLPSAVATTKPPGLFANTGNIFFSTTSTTTVPASRSQSIYDVNDIPVAAANWTSLSVRRPHGISNVNPAVTANAVIVLSHATNAHSAASTTFAANTGALATTVVNGAISLPSQGNPPVWPAAWVPIPFTTAFPYVKALGASLVIDIYYTVPTATTSWIVEYSVVDTGQRDENGGYMPNCKFSTGSASGSLSHQNPRVGANWYVVYNSIVANAAGVGAIGAQGVGGLWGSIPLPIDLTPFNAPGCKWTVSVDVTMAMTTNANGSGGWGPPGIAVPNVPFLIGAKFYDQAAFLDAPANGLGVGFTWPSTWTVGSNTGPAATTVVAVGNNASAATGSRSINSAQSIQLN